MSKFFSSFFVKKVTHNLFVLFVACSWSPFHSISCIRPPSGKIQRVLMCISSVLCFCVDKGKENSGRIFRLRKNCFRESLFFVYSNSESKNRPLPEMVFNGLFWKSNLNFFVHFFCKPSYRNKKFDVF